MITAIGMIKNAADIIESFIRGNGMTVDNYVLLDNMCTDNTIPIINQLKSEGYQIDIIPDNENAYFQSAKMNLLIQFVLKNYQSDWILPLDDDEVLFSLIEGVSPREMIESLDGDKLYFVKWRNYIPTDEDDYGEICALKRQQYCYSDNMKTNTKIIIPRNIAQNEQYRISQGNHDMYGVEIDNKVLLNEMRLAHFPCRSKEQMISKGLIGWTNNLAIYQRNPGIASQWKKIYEMVKSGQELTTEMLWNVCINYVRFDNEDEICVEHLPLELPEEAYEIKYTQPDEVNPFLNYLNNTEQLAIRYAELCARLNDKK